MLVGRILTLSMPVHGTGMSSPLPRVSHVVSYHSRAAVGLEPEFCSGAV